MLPVLEGIIARRILLNFRVDPRVIQRLLPPPLVVEERNGSAIAGLCLIRLEHLRPKGMPSVLGVSSENMAHRVAVRYPTAQGMRPGVFIWRRDTNARMVRLLGGRVFPGVHHGAEFQITENTETLSIDVRSEDGETDVAFAAHPAPWTRTTAFPEFRDAEEFFRQGDCGFSCSMNGDKLEGLQLRTLCWQMEPLAVDLGRCAFYMDRTRFPAGTVEFDCGLMMRGLPHEWHEMADVPELAAV